MIFVTVGTHEQPFDRLIRCIDDLKASGRISEDVFIQTGFSDYEPSACSYSKLVSADRMNELIASAHIIITHGGPASFLAPLKEGKIPIVVPRMKLYGEHVNDHQVDFTRAVAARQGNIILVEDVSELAKTIKNYDTTIAAMNNKGFSNTEHFTSELEKIALDLVAGRKK